MVFNHIAGSVREVLSGVDDGQSEIVARIAAPAGAPGWFVPGDAIWTVHGSVATFLGGIRSLLLQALHPLALAGVNRHSNYRADPFGRLQRTGAFIAATTFGSTELAEQTVAGIRHMHTSVNGELSDGRRYSAQDPHLLEWVHIVLVDSMLTAYLDFALNGPIEPDEYVANMAVVGRAMGVREPPETRAELTAHLQAFRPELVGGAEAIEVKDFVLAAPLPRGLRPGYAIMCRTALDTLPPWAAELLAHDASPAVRKTRWLTTDLALRLLKTALVQSPALAAGEARLAGVPADRVDKIITEPRSSDGKYR
ncbi:MAG: DUF2236 domain-containing protein [Actinomycetia bacterium]|nr:DUF2236 domain-containing protein [Actinomycetes bacterium]